MLGVLCMALGSFCGITMVLGFGVAWATAEAQRGVTHRLSILLACLSVPMLAGAPTTMLLTAWPHRLAFLASQPALERLADRVAAGQAPHSPAWAGVYLVG